MAPGSQVPQRPSHHPPHCEAIRNPEATNCTSLTEENYLRKPKKMLLMTQGTSKQHVGRTHTCLSIRPSIQHSQRGFSDPTATKPLKDWW